MRKRFSEGYLGLKLYPTTDGYLISSKDVYPVFEEAQSLGWPIVIHLGITLEYESDLRFANPIELHTVAKDFPNLSFVIPHFGAGFFRELLFLGYHINNIFVDTSGLNRWRSYVPYELSLEQVFKKTVEVFGAEKIIYGTDSRFCHIGYRDNVLSEQLEILRNLNLSDAELSLIFGQNMLQLIGKA